MEKSAVVNSILTFSTIDGPGIRTVIFLQGCPFKCCYCHNPETWGFNDGNVYNFSSLLSEIEGYIPYYGDNGGVTISGGECLFHYEFLVDFLSKCKERGIHTAIDTSGMLGNFPNRKEIKRSVFRLADLVILDVKFADDEKYQNFTNGRLEDVIESAEILGDYKVPVWIRQVIIQGINDNYSEIEKLKSLISKYFCIEKVEFLPFKKLCLGKYQNLSLEFPFENIPETPLEVINKLQNFYENVK